MNRSMCALLIAVALTTDLTGWVTKYMPKGGADPSRLVGRKLVIRE